MRRRRPEQLRRYRMRVIEHKVIQAASTMAASFFRGRSFVLLQTDIEE